MVVYLQLENNSESAKRLLDFLKTLSYIKVIEIEGIPKIQKKQRSKTKSMKISKEILLSDFRKSLEEVKEKKVKHLKELIDVK